MSELFDKLFRILFLVLFIAIVAAGVFTAYPKYRKAESLDRTRADLEQRIAEKRRAIDELKEKQSRFSVDRDFVEALARENRRVFPGELVFIFDK